jgi:hypothetical protein
MQEKAKKEDDNRDNAGINPAIRKMRGAGWLTATR